MRLSDLLNRMAAIALVLSGCISGWSDRPELDRFIVGLPFALCSSLDIGGADPSVGLGCCSGDVDDEDPVLLGDADSCFCSALCVCCAV